MSTYLPQEVVTNILLRLPVTPLTRFMSVSKSWKSLISSPEFITLHIQHSLKTQTNLLIIARSPLAIYAAPFHSPENTAAILRNPFDNLHNQFCCSVFFIGSCNGLLALHNSEGKIALWNPSTGEDHWLVSPRSSVEDYGKRLFGREYIVCSFGFDSVSDDYKLVRIVQFNGGVMSECMVYSLKGKCWKRIGDFPYYFRGQPRCGFLNDNGLHWVVFGDAESETNPFVVKLDLGSGDYSEVALPVFEEDDFIMNLEVMEGRLCLICNYLSNRLDVWIMEEYGVKESWVKLARFDPQVIGEFKFVRPLAYSTDKNEVLLEQDAEKFVWFDLKSKQAKRVRINGLPDFYESCVCVGSLVSLKGGVGGGRDEKIKAKQKPQAGESKKNQSNKKRDDFLSTGFKLRL